MSKKLWFVLLGIPFIVVVAGEYVTRDVLAAWLASTTADWELANVRRQVAQGQMVETEAQERLFQIARQNPGSQMQVCSLIFLANQWPDSSAAPVAITELSVAIDQSPVSELARWFDANLIGSGEQWHAIARALIARAAREPQHPRSGKLLATAAIGLRPSELDTEPSDELLRLADLIRADFATSPDLANFFEVVGNLGTPQNWMHHFEPHVRTILEVNPDRFTRCSAHFALATIVRSGGNKRWEEAVHLHEAFLAEFDGNTPYPAQSIEQRYRQNAKLALNMMRIHGPDISAPENGE